MPKLWCHALNADAFFEGGKVQSPARSTHIFNFETTSQHLNVYSSSSRLSPDIHSHLVGQAFEELEVLLAKYDICIAVKEKLVKDSGVAEENVYDNIILRLQTKPRAKGNIRQLYELVFNFYD